MLIAKAWWDEVSSAFDGLGDDASATGGAVDTGGVTPNADGYYIGPESPGPTKCSTCGSDPTSEGVSHEGGSCSLCGGALMHIGGGETVDNGQMMAA